MTVQELIYATKGYHGIEDCKAEGRFDECELCQAITKAQQPYTPDNGPPYPWVKVEDGLPERCPQTVLCVFESAVCNRFIARATLRGDIWYFCDDNEKVEPLGFNATHWQYLPSLPE